MEDGYHFINLAHMLINSLTTQLGKFKSKIAISTAFLIGCFVGFITLTSCTKSNGLPDPLEARWNGQSVCEELEVNEKVRVLKCTFPPGVGHEKHYHNPYYGYTLKGSKFRITDSEGTRDVDLPTGTDFYNEGVAWHEVLNIGDSTAIFLIIEPK